MRVLRTQKGFARDPNFATYHTVLLIAMSDVGVLAFKPLDKIMA